MDVPSQLDLVLRLLAAALVGGLIGFERELRDHPAGLRTHMMVAVGSALFVIAGAYGWGELVAERSTTNITIGVDRVASNIVTGIGFLGGGAILKYGANIKGLTTAASLWVTSALGLAAGLGSFLLVGAATLVTLLSLVVLRLPERWIQRKLALDRETVVIRLEARAETGAVIAALAGLDGVEIRSMSVRGDEDEVVIEAALVGPRGAAMAQHLAPVAQRDDVASVDLA